MNNVKTNFEDESNKYIFLVQESKYLMLLILINIQIIYTLNKILLKFSEKYFCGGN